ncbi:MAG TPA: hypothetical protein VGM78_04550, partial [Ilumatobacteraceae bacterium]
MQQPDDRSRLSLTRIRSFAARSLLTIPIATLLVILVLGMSKISGSSIALHSPTGTSAQLAGQPRPVRSDEYGTRTPLVVRQAALGYPSDTQLGVGTHDTGVLTDLPVKSAAAVVKPHSWAYFVVGVQRGFAIEWWLEVLGPFLGVYAVLAVITRARLVPALAGVLASAAPALLWWAIPSAGFTVLYGGMAAALLILAFRVEGWRRYALAAVAGWLAAAFAALLYVPWLIPLTLIFGAIIVVQLPSAVRGWRQFGLLCVPFVGVFGILMAIFFHAHHD